MLDAVDWTWLTKEVSESTLCQSQVIENVSSFQIFNNILKRYNHPKSKTFVEHLMAGELARRDFSEFKHLYILDRDKKRKPYCKKLLDRPENGELLVPTMEFENEAAFYGTIDKLFEKYGRKHEFAANVCVRCIYDGIIDAGVGWGHN